MPPAKEKASDTAGALLSCTSQALMPSGVVTALMSTAPAAAGSSESAATSAARKRNSQAHRMPSCGVSTEVTSPSARQTWRAARDHGGRRDGADALRPGIDVGHGAADAQRAAVDARAALQRILRVDRAGQELVLRALDLFGR